MKSNFKELFDAILPGLKTVNDIDIETLLNNLVPQIEFDNPVTYEDLKRDNIRHTLTSALNAEEIYSFQKGHFIYYKNADEEKLKHFMEKAEHDIAAADKRKQKAEDMLNQYKLAWDENNNFVGLILGPQKQGQST